MSHLMNTYARLPVNLVRGEGVFVFDDTGKRYLDALSGIAVNTLGHAHPRLVKALSAQVASLIHVSNIYHVPESAQLSDKLTALAQMDEVFFCNSGCEANEAALKLARMYGHKKGIEKPIILVMSKAFHGRTLATLWATGNEKVQKGFTPVVEGFLRVPFDDLAAIETIANDNPNIVAVLLEPIQGEGGVRQAHLPYLKALRDLCTQKGWLMMLDEVQCGMGRTGVWFMHQSAGIKPDVMTLSKGLGSGVPIGACLAAGPAAGVFGPGNHGSTFGGNPLACRAALTTLEVMEDDQLLANAGKIGQLIRDELAVSLSGVPGVKEIRGSGLIIGIELDRPCADLVKQALAAGLLINVTADSVIRLLPALTFSAENAHQLVDILAPLIITFLKNPT